MHTYPRMSLIAFSYRYEIKTVNVILLQNQKLVLCKFQMNISDRTKGRDVKRMACYTVKTQNI